MQLLQRLRCTLLLSLVIISILLASCSRSEGLSDGERELKVVVSSFPSFDAVRAILGDSKQITMLLPPGQESHSYEPTIKDMIAISDADLIVYTGGESDEWVEKIIASSENAVAIFRLIDHSSLLYIDEGEHGAELDEHVWTSIRNEAAIISALRDVICTLDPDNAALYSDNASSYLTELAVLDREAMETVASADSRVLIFASRFPFRYFAADYGLECYAAFPSCAEESEPSARRIAFLIDKAREEGVKYLATVEFSSISLSTLMSEETRTEVLRLNSMHNITKKAFRDGETYITIMRENLKNLEKALER